MSWTDALTGYGFRNWLLQVASGGRIPQGQDLDPFTTSMRDLKQVSGYLESIQAEGSLDLSSERTTDQRLIDLGSAELVSRTDRTLTNLGRNVLRRWRDVGIANDEEEDEIPRCLVLVQEADALGSVQYQRVLGFWRELRKVFVVDELLDNPRALYLLSYLNQETAGYNPWAVVRSVAGGSVDKRVIDWHELAKRIPDPTDDLEKAIDNFARRIHDYSTRAAGRVSYCRAMELYALDLAAAREAVQRWSLPEATVKHSLEVLATGPDQLHRFIARRERAWNLEDELRRRYKDMHRDDQRWQAVEELLKMGARNLLFVGPPGTSKTTYALAIGARLTGYVSKRLKKIQFHQSFGYESFMEGYVPSGDSDTGFVLSDQIFLDACWDAYVDPDKYHVLVIDELNRGDPSRVFGEALTYIELRDEVFTLPSGKERVVPGNLIIIATMNPYDKSIASLDQATDRRFEKVTFDPDPELLREILVESGAPQELMNSITEFFVFLTAIVEDRIGHAYFKGVTDETDLQMVWEHRLLPVLEQELRYDEDKLKEILDEFKTRYGA